MDPRLGTDTPGPGEAVLAIRVNGKPQIVTKKCQIKTRTNILRILNILIRILFGDELETSAVYTFNHFDTPEDSEVQQDDLRNSPWRNLGMLSLNLRSKTFKTCIQTPK